MRPRILEYATAAACMLPGFLPHISEFAAAKEPEAGKSAVSPSPPIVSAEGCNIERFTVHSDCMGREIKCQVILPPEYGSHPDKKYPVLYALHSAYVTDGSDYTSWSEMSGALQALKEKPMIIASFDADNYSYYIDSPLPVKCYQRGYDFKKEWRTNYADLQNVTPVKSR
jgi:hypothetical protein